MVSGAAVSHGHVRPQRSEQWSEVAGSWRPDAGWPVVLLELRAQISRVTEGTRLYTTEGLHFSIALSLSLSLSCSLSLLLSFSLSLSRHSLSLSSLSLFDGGR